MQKRVSSRTGAVCSKVLTVLLALVSAPIIAPAEASTSGKAAPSLAPSAVSRRAVAPGAGMVHGMAAPDVGARPPYVGAAKQQQFITPARVLAAKGARSGSQASGPT